MLLRGSPAHQGGRSLGFPVLRLRTQRRDRTAACAGVGPAAAMHKHTAQAITPGSYCWSCQA